MKILELLETQVVIKTVIRLYFFGILLLIVGGLLWLNNFDSGTLVISIGGVLLSFYYIIQTIFPPFKTDYDWSLVYPELVGIESNNKGD